MFKGERKLEALVLRKKKKEKRRLKKDQGKVYRNFQKLKPFTSQESFLQTCLRLKDMHTHASLKMKEQY